MGPRAKQAGLLKRPVGDQMVVYDEARQRLHVLNRTTALVWAWCDGTRTVADIARVIAPILGSSANSDVVELALAQLEETHLLETPTAPARAAGDMSRRKMLQAAAAVAVGVLLPSITSCGFPIAPDARLVDGGAMLDVNVTTTTSTTGTTSLGTTTSTTGTTPLGTTTSTTGTTPLGTTTTSTTPLFTTTTSTTSPLVTTTSTTSTTTTSTTTTSTTTTTPEPRKVEMCHRGKTITVDRHAVPGLLRAGATLGRCP